MESTQEQGPRAWSADEMAEQILGCRGACLEKFVEKFNKLHVPIGAIAALDWQFLFESVGSREVVIELIRYLLLKVYIDEVDEPGVQTSPSRVVDEAWHKFLLYTKQYDTFCQTAAGRLIHHDPRTAHNGTVRERYEFTLNLYLKVFGFKSAYSHHWPQLQDFAGNATANHAAGASSASSKKRKIDGSRSTDKIEIILDAPMMPFHSPLRLRVTPSTRIETIDRVCRKYFGKEVRLLFAGEKLLGSKTVSSYGIAQGDVIDVLFALKGC